MISFYIFQSKVRNTMSYDEIKQTIANILNIENSAAWEITSCNDGKNLYMIHHKPEADLIKYGDIRGIVVDTKAKIVVCRSYGYTPIIVANSLSTKMFDTFGIEHTLDQNNVRFNVGYEGTLINIFKHDGEVYRSTRKRLDAERSRWGASKTFAEMYRQLGGPSDDTLFDPMSKYSPWVHSFIIVHPDVLVVSKDNIDQGYLVYLGSKKMYSTEYDECPYKQLRQDGTLFVNEDQFSQDERVNAGWIDPVSHEPSNFLTPASLTLEEANHHLMFGAYESFDSNYFDVRMLPGEFIIVHQTDTGKMLRVESGAYSWRSQIRDNDPNLLHRFFCLVSQSYNQSTIEKYPIFTPYNEESIKAQIETGGYVVWPQIRAKVDMSKKESRLYNIWLVFLNAVPLHRQKEVSGYLNYLYTKRNELISWLRYLENLGHFDPSLFSKRVLNIIETARKFAGKNTNGKTVKNATKDNIRNLIMKEEGSSLYRLIKEMDVNKKEQTR